MDANSALPQLMRQPNTWRWPLLHHLPAFVFLVLSAAAAGPLQFGDVNIMVTTDMHGWVAGHTHPDYPAPPRNADFGQLVSFHQRLKAAAASQGKDLWLFDNGDVVDGTGLTAAGSVDGQLLFPLLQSVPYDALGIGNHELYKNSTVLRGLLGEKGFVSHWGGKYLTSNVQMANGAPLGSRSITLHGRFGQKILVMGFLYEMPDHCGAVTVGKINATVAEPWFHEAVSQEGLT